MFLTFYARNKDNSWPGPIDKKRLQEKEGKILNCQLMKVRMFSECECVCQYIRKFYRTPTEMVLMVLKNRRSCDAQYTTEIFVFRRTS